MSKECDKPRNPATVTCRNCDQMGHFSKECPLPRDYSKVKCSNCDESTVLLFHSYSFLATNISTVGHTKVRCKNPPKEDDVGSGGGGGGDFDAPHAGGDDFSAPPATAGVDDWGTATGADSWGAAPAAATTAAGGW